MAVFFYHKRLSVPVVGDANQADVITADMAVIGSLLKVADIKQASIHTSIFKRLLTVCT